MFVDGKLATKTKKGKIRPTNDFFDSVKGQNNSLVRSSLHLEKSVLNSNNRIKFSKEQRFFGNLEDKQSTVVSYQEPPNMDFRQSRVNKYYRGASIGRGSKHDFT